MGGSNGMAARVGMGCRAEGRHLALVMGTELQGHGDVGSKGQE